MQYGDYRWTQIRDVASRVAVLPLGALEQHGHHLPLLTDSMIGAEIVRRAETALGEVAVFLPMLWVGVSDHHRHFPGTISLNAETYTHVVADLLESLVGGGFKRVLVLNSHGGNVLPGKRAVYDVRMRHREEPDLWLVFASWFELAAAQVVAMDVLQQKLASHASELETSMILRLRPELVDMDAARGASIPFASAFYCPDVSSGSRVTVSSPQERLSITGALGHPELGTSEKGEALFSVAAEEAVACVREIATWPTLEPA